MRRAAFVPNITIGPVVAIRKRTRLTLDVHLMIVEPETINIPEFIAGRRRHGHRATRGVPAHAAHARADRESRAKGACANSVHADSLIESCWTTSTWMLVMW